MVRESLADTAAVFANLTRSSPILRALPELFPEQMDREMFIQR